MIVLGGRGLNIVTHGYNFIVEFFNKKKIKKVEKLFNFSKVSINLNKVVRCNITLEVIERAKTFSFNGLKNIEIRFNKSRVDINTLKNVKCYISLANISN